MMWKNSGTEPGWRNNWHHPGFSLPVGRGSRVCYRGCPGLAGGRLPQTGPRPAGLLVHGRIGTVRRTDAAEETRDEVAQLADSVITVRLHAIEFDAFLRAGAAILCAGVDIFPRVAGMELRGQTRTTIRSGGRRWATTQRLSGPTRRGIR